MQSRFFLCCPMCGRRMPKDWLAKVTAGYRRWGYVLSYLGRREIKKTAEVLVGATPPPQVKGLVGEAGETLAAVAAVLLYDLTMAGWQPAFLRTLGFELVRRRIVEPVVEYIDRMTPPAHYAGTAQAAGPVRWEPMSAHAGASPVVESSPAAPVSAPAGAVRWEVVKP
jgi:hypothetical protein